MSQALPADPDIAWLKKTAKQRLRTLRTADPTARLHQAQLDLARDHGFPSWRALKVHIDGLSVFAAARSGDADMVARALARGFDPYTTDAGGRTIHQIAKDLGREKVEIVVRNHHARETRAKAVVEAIDGILQVAATGPATLLAERLDAHPELINALGGGFQTYSALHCAAGRNRHDCLRLLLDRGADIGIRDFPDNATALHVAAAVGDLDTVRFLVEGGADVVGLGDDYEVGVLGWATCFRAVRADIAAYLLDHGAPLTLWTAIALDRGPDLRAMIERDPALLGQRMTRNQHRRTALHHAAARNRPAMVGLLLDLGADAGAVDATGATALTTATQEGADEAVVAALLAAGAPLDFLTALNLGRYDAAELMLRDDPARIGPDGRDTIALHLAVNRRKHDVIAWLIAHGVAIDARRPMWACNHTALHMTVENGEIGIARALLDAGADPNVRDDKYNSTALGWALFFGRPDFAELFRERGGV